MTERRRQKHRLLLQLGRTCALCERAQATDLHEIVNRQRTVGNAEARRLSMVDELVVLLCNPCNLRADTDTIRRRLLDHNSRLYGQAAVKAALEQLATAIKLSDLFLQWGEE